jgi:hypothetical protein
MKNLKKISVHRLSFQIYGHFTEILACIAVYTYKSNVDISTSNFADT